MDKKRLDEIRARCEAATPGPWFVEEIFSASRKMLLEVCANDHLSGEFDASFIVCVRQDAPDLLDALEGARAENEELSLTVESMGAAITEYATRVLSMDAEIDELAECVHSVIEDRKHFEAEVRRLREGLSRLHSQFGVGRCDVCAAWCDVRSDNKQHHDDCPFAILET